MSSPPVLQAYRRSSIMTATPAQLVVMLYDGAQRFLSQAAAAFRHGMAADAHVRLRRAEDVVLELLTTLDHERGGDIATELQTLYAFCLDELAAAREAQDADRIDTVAGLLSELRESWATLAAGAA